MLLPERFPKIVRLLLVAASVSGLSISKCITYLLNELLKCQMYVDIIFYSLVLIRKYCPMYHGTVKC